MTIPVSIFYALAIRQQLETDETVSKIAVITGKNTDEILKIANNECMSTLNSFYDTLNYMLNRVMWGGEL